MHPFIDSTSTCIELEFNLNYPKLEFLKDHKVHSEEVFPATGYIETILYTLKQIENDYSWQLQNILFSKILKFQHDTRLKVSVQKKENVFNFELFSRTSTTGWTSHVKGEAVHTQIIQKLKQFPESLSDVKSSMTVYDQEYFYGYLDTMTQLRYGPYFQGVQKLWYNGEEKILAKIKLPKNLSLTNYNNHPVLFDALLQAISAAPVCVRKVSSTTVPVGMGSYKQYGPIPEEIYAYGTNKRIVGSNDTFILTAKILNPEGQILVEIDGIITKEIKAISVSSEKQNIQHLKSETTTKPTFKSNAVLRTVWTPTSPSISPVPNSTNSTSPRTWLLMCTPNNHTDKVHSELRSRGHKVVLIHPGLRFQKINDSSYTYDPHDKNSIIAILEEIKNNFANTTVEIVNLMNLSNFKYADMGSELSSEAISNCHASFLLIQELAKKQDKVQSLFSIVTDIDNPTHAMTLGMLRSVGNEHPDLQVIRVRVDRENWDAATVINAIVSRTMPEIHISGKQVHALKLVVDNSKPTPKPFNPNGSYIITGGLGALGVEFSNWLKSKNAKEVIIVSKRASSAETDKHIKEMSNANTKFYYYSADIGDYDSCIAFGKWLKQTCLPLKGIIHSAGIIEDGMIINLTWESFEKISRPKVWGAINLTELAKQNKLDFFTLFSSAAATIGNPGQSNYSAANFFLSEYAEYLAKQGIPCSSVSWGPWLENGMATTEIIKKSTARRGVHPITNAEGVSLFENIAINTTGSLTYCEIDWQKMINFLSNLEKPYYSELLGSNTSDQVSAPAQLHISKSIPSFTASPKASIDSFVNKIRLEVARIMEYESPSTIDTNKPLNDMGLDSLMGVELRNSLSKAFHTQTPATLIFEHPTIGALATYFANQIGENLHHTAQPQISTMSAQPTTLPPATQSSKSTTDSPNSVYLEILKAEVARIMEFNPMDIDINRPLAEMGLDSLMGVELRNAVGAKLKVNVPATLVFEYPTISAIANFLYGQSTGKETKQPQEIAATTKSAPSETVVKSVSNATNDYVTLIRQEIARIMEYDSIDSIDPNRALTDMGLDSLMGVELRNSISSKLGTQVPATLVFEYPTISLIANFLTSQNLQKTNGSFEPTKTPLNTPVNPTLGEVVQIKSSAANDVLNIIKGEVARIMEFDNLNAIEIDRPLQDMGLDSLMGVELRNSISQKLQVQVPATLVFEYPTISALSKFISEKTKAA